MVLYEYIWIDAQGSVRSKTKVTGMVENMNELPIWNFDGSSTNQASGDNSEVYIRPVYMCRDPFRSENDRLVLCETLTPDYKPHISNTRSELHILLNENIDMKPMFGFEQEFFVLERGTVAKLDYDSNEPQGDYYCGVGTANIKIREFAEDAMEKCLKAGLTITGMNAEVAPNQWEFQVCTYGIEASDQLYILRYILNRLGEERNYNYEINIEPKPFSEKWNGSGCHTNFSTHLTRIDGGETKISEIIGKLEKRHGLHMSHYGKNNHLRMTGECETASFDKFTYGYGDRGASIRIPTIVKELGKGYIEDRRPGSNMDPYIVSRLLVETAM